MTKLITPNEFALKEIIIAKYVEWQKYHIHFLAVEPHVTHETGIASRATYQTIAKHDLAEEAIQELEGMIREAGYNVIRSLKLESPKTGEKTILLQISIKDKK